MPIYIHLAFLITFVFFDLCIYVFFRFVLFIFMSNYGRFRITHCVNVYNRFFLCIFIRFNIRRTKLWTVIQHPVHCFFKSRVLEHSEYKRKSKQQRPFTIKCPLLFLLRKTSCRATCAAYKYSSQALCPCGLTAQ